MQFYRIYRDGGDALEMAVDVRRGKEAVYVDHGSGLVKVSDSSYFEDVLELCIDLAQRDAFRRRKETP